ncbi:hypothetical protein DAMA08_045150 [Martiniozyma asiatica (nom. inval.)]|nr:hypothetical protein DAMA08_045150 [Martiniozyma asiatica]
MTNTVKIPDLRFYNTFNSRANTVGYARTILVDVMIMPLVQSFAMAVGLYYLKPVMRYAMGSGRESARSVRLFFSHIVSGLTGKRSFS